MKEWIASFLLIDYLHKLAAEISVFLGAFTGVCVL